MKIDYNFKHIISLIFSSLFFGLAGISQNYTTIIDTFYVSTPEYNTTLGIDSLHFPCAITTPNVGSNFPVLILVHGTAVLDMNSSSSKDYLDSVGASYRKAETAMFYEIAHSASSNGIIVLRYDKRSFTVNCIEKPACWYVDTISPYDYIYDIHNAVDFAKSIPLADTCNIFLAGHSQGGSFVSQVGYDREDIKGILNMAGTAQPLDSVAIYQEEFINGNQIGATILRQQFDSLRAGTWPMTDTLYNSHFSPRFWLDWISHSDSAVYVQKNSDKATALMYGTADRFVPATTHYQIWQDSVSRPNVTFQLFNQIDHGFGTEYDSLMSPVVLNFMNNWIHSTSESCSPLQISNEKIKPEINVYPNPSSNLITLQSNKEGIAIFRISNIAGDVVSQGRLINQEPLVYDISKLVSGLYFIEMENAVIKMIKN